MTLQERIVCWGRPKALLPDHLADEAFLQVSCGGSYGCGVRKDGDIECWGGFPGGLPEFDEDSRPFVQVSVGHPVGCGLHDDGTVECWGAHYHPVTTEVPEGQFSQISVSAAGYACALRVPSNEATCWGVASRRRLDAPEGESFVQITTSKFFACGLSEATGHAICWGDKARWSSGAPPEEMAFLELSAGVDQVCGVTGLDDEVGLVGDEDDEPLRVYCWGRDAGHKQGVPSHIELSPPPLW